MCGVSTPDPHVDERLRRERTIWLATVDEDGAPTVRPVWFVWDGLTVVVYSRPRAAKIRQIEANPRVCLHLDPDDWGEDVVIVAGMARIALELPPPDQAADYVTKYAQGMQRLGVTPTKYAADYRVPVEIRPTRFLSY